MFPIAWVCMTGYRAAFVTHKLSKREKELLRELSGKPGRWRRAKRPVWFGANLASNGHGAGARLVAATSAALDRADLAVVAGTEAGVLRRLYTAHGFEEAGRANLWWGTQLLMYREPKKPAMTATPPGKPQAQPPAAASPSPLWLPVGQPSSAAQQPPIAAADDAARRGAEQLIGH